MQHPPAENERQNAANHAHALLGAHVSIAGSLTRAIDRAQALDAECFQIFTRPPGTWKGRVLAEADALAFRDRRPPAEGPPAAGDRGDLPGTSPAVSGACFRGPAFVHDIYLTNLAAPADDLRARSIASLTEQRRHCERLGIDGLVCHMGAHLEASVETGLARFSDALQEVLEQTRECHVPILLENSAGQGTCLGYDLAHLEVVLERCGRPRDIGVCLDTCHLFAAGYDLTNPHAYEQIWDLIETRLERSRLRLFHLNDSKRGLGCRVDRHEHIGEGAIGEELFHRLLTDPRVNGIPMVIETSEADDGHRRDLELLRRLRCQHEYKKDDVRTAK